MMWKVTVLLFFYKYLTFILLPFLLIPFFKWGYPYLKKDLKQKKSIHKVSLLFCLIFFVLVLSNVVLLSKPQAFVSTTKMVEVLETERQVLRLKKEQERQAKDSIDKLYSEYLRLFSTQEENKKTFTRENLDVALSNLAKVPQNEHADYQEKIKILEEQIVKQEDLNIAETVKDVYRNTHSYGWNETLAEAETRKNSVTRERYNELLPSVELINDENIRNGAIETLKIIDRWLIEQGL